MTIIDTILEKDRRPKNFRKEWTKENDEYLRKSYKKIPTMVIADRLQRTEFSIHSRGKSLGLSKRYKKNKLPYTYSRKKILDFIETPVYLSDLMAQHPDLTGSQLSSFRTSIRERVRALRDMGHKIVSVKIGRDMLIMLDTKRNRIDAYNMLRKHKPRIFRHIYGLPRMVLGPYYTLDDVRESIVKRETIPTK